MTQIQNHQTDSLTALGNSVRREIVHMLSQKNMSVGEIAAQLPVSRPAISKHLKLLKNAKLIEVEAMGTRNIYRLEQKGFNDAKQWLDGFWGEALVRFKLLAENSETENKADV